MPTWEIHRLAAGHDRTEFDCGQPVLNEWLKHRAGQFERRDLNRTFVAVHSGQACVVGFYALTSHRVSYDCLPTDEAKGLPRIDVPVVLLGRLAVDKGEQGQGLGAYLLVDALRRSQHLADQIGIRAVEVDAIDDAARHFYLKYGFIALLDDPNHLFLPMASIRHLKLPPMS